MGCDAVLLVSLLLEEQLLDEESQMVTGGNTNLNSTQRVHAIKEAMWWWQQQRIETVNSRREHSQLERRWLSGKHHADLVQY